MQARIVITAAAAAGVGYVLGARAGRGRYREIRHAALRARRSPALRHSVKEAKKGIGRLTKGMRA